MTDQCWKWVCFARILCAVLNRFFPFTAVLRKSFDEHRNHGCTLRQTSLIQKTCKRNLRVEPGGDKDAVLAMHLGSGKCIRRKERRRKRCKAKGCKNILLVPFTCNSCALSFCAKHRIPSSHACKGYQAKRCATSALIRGTSARACIAVKAM